MARTQTLVQLTDELVELLDRHAARDGVSRSQLIRHLLERQLAEDRRADTDRRMREGYDRHGQADAEPDAWGDLAVWTAANTRRNQASLNAEEAERW